ncbi:MAG: RsmD family RNA methyltransferase [Phycisphaerales bacterium]
MRIIAGEFRRRILETPPDAEITRPIPDRVKESLFGLLRGHFQGATVFDGFAGTGAIGLEAVSRGAKRCVLVEKHPAIAAILERNIAELGCGERCDVVRGDALGPGSIARCPRPLTLSFLDPPYPLVREVTGYRRVMAQMKALVALLSDDGFAVLRTPYPLMLETAVIVPEAPVEPRRKPKRKGNERSKWKQEIFNPRPRRKDEAPELVEPDVVVDAAAPAVEIVKPELIPADLQVEGANGPETHVYHNMAVHLYMRRR